MPRSRPPRLAAPAPRRSQAERAEQMRARLLDTTIQCLSAQGYAAMSTNDIVRAAHVSRGALAHHFPTKTALLTAAAERLIDQRGAEFRERFTAIAPQRRTPAEALSVLWSFYDDPGSVALIELTVAARSHPELMVVTGSVTQRIEAITAEVFVEFFPELAGLPFAEEALRAVHALFAGLVLSSMGHAKADDHGAEVRAFLKLLVSLSGQFAPLLAGLPASRAAAAGSLTAVTPIRSPKPRSRR